MIFSRHHYKKNLINPDEKTLEHVEGVAEWKPDWKPEVFSVSSMLIRTKDHIHNLSDDNTLEVIESSNYFTVIHKNKTKIFCIKYDDVLTLEFILNHPVQAISEEGEEVSKK